MMLVDFDNFVKIFLKRFKIKKTSFLTYCLDNTSDSVITKINFVTDQDKSTSR